MNSKRTARVEAEIQKVLSAAILYRLKDPKVSKGTSVTAVEVSPDISYADVYISVLGKEWDKKQTLQGLESSKGFLKRQLGEKMRLPKIPELRFHLDNSIEYGLYMDRLIERTIAEDERKHQEVEERQENEQEG